MTEQLHLRKSFEASPVAMVLTDPSLPDNPLVFVNETFERITLYNQEAVLGRNCRLLQCEDTDPEAIRQLAEAIRSETPVSVDLLNERADGSRFMNRLVIAPMRDSEGRTVAFIGLQSEIGQAATDGTATRTADSDNMLRELQHRVKNHLAMVVSLIRIHSRRDVTQASFDALGHRVQSLALLYEEISINGVARSDAETLPAGAYLSRVANTIAALDGRASIRINVDCDEIELPIDTGGRIGLLLTEFLTNALEHAFRGREAGVIGIRFKRQTEGHLRLTVEDDGIGLPEGSSWPDTAPSVEQRVAEAREEVPADPEAGPRKRKSGAGGSIVKAMVKHLRGDLIVSSNGHGTTVTLDLMT